MAEMMGSRITDQDRPFHYAEHRERMQSSRLARETVPIRKAELFS